jgi:hypothetical protein
MIPHFELVDLDSLRLHALMKSRTELVSYAGQKSHFHEAHPFVLDFRDAYDVAFPAAVFHADA